MSDDIVARTILPDEVPSDAIIADTVLPADVRTFMQHLNAKDPVALVIRAHLYVESAINRLVESALVNREALNVVRTPFMAKLNLAFGLGRINRQDRGACAALNDLRNLFAHNVSAQLTDQHEKDFYNALSDRQRQVADGLRKREMDFVTRLRCDVLSVIVHLEGAAHKAPGQERRLPKRS